ncbi:MAG: type II toxin-antitoxin system RelE/ParE family toxin [Bacteroidales bacterium]
MRKFNLKINPFAEEDIIDSYEFYESEKEGLGVEFVQEIKKTIARIEDNPNQFPKIRNQIRVALANRFPFIIIYYIKGLIINVFAVFHTSRNPKAWRQRIKK